MFSTSAHVGVIFVYILVI